MQLTTKAIVLSSLKYGDTSLIVKAFTASDGLKSYLLKGILSSKKGRLKAAYFQPLTQIEITAFHKNKGTLESIKDLRLNYHYKTLHNNIAKNGMAIFLAEMLSNSIHEEEQNNELFNFLEASLQWFDNQDKIANFHLYFLLVLTKYFGFYPDKTHIQLPCFDLVEGSFINTSSINPILVGNNLNYFKSMLGTNFDNLNSIKMSKTNRQELLQSLIVYYKLHLQGFRKPKSIAILNEVFN